MGITTYTASKLSKIIEEYKPKNVGEYGSQNLYFDGCKLPAPFANEFYESKGVEYTCFDLSKENNCLEYDLTYLLPESFNDNYDLVTDIGCSEHYGREGKHHIEGIYNAWLNKHNILKVGGVMYNENPKTLNWPLHGVNYYSFEFYKKLLEFIDYEVISLEEHFAMGNFIDGCNIACTLEKKGNKFISFENFKQLPIYKK